MPVQAGPVISAASAVQEIIRGNSPTCHNVDTAHNWPLVFLFVIRFLTIYRCTKGLNLYVEYAFYS